MAEKMFRVEIVKDGETIRRWFRQHHHAEEYLIEFAVVEFGGVRPASGNDAREVILDSDSVAWCSLDEVEAQEVGACPSCDIQGGWDGGYCEPCGYQFGSLTDDDGEPLVR